MFKDYSRRAKDNRVGNRWAHHCGRGVSRFKRTGQDRGSLEALLISIPITACCSNCRWLLEVQLCGIHVKSCCAHLFSLLEVFSPVSDNHSASLLPCYLYRPGADSEVTPLQRDIRVSPNWPLLHVRCSRSRSSRVLYCCCANKPLRHRCLRAAVHVHKRTQIITVYSRGKGICEQIWKGRSMLQVSFLLSFKRVLVTRCFEYFT